MQILKFEKSKHLREAYQLSDTVTSGLEGNNRKYQIFTYPQTL